MKVKICGVRSERDALAVVRAGADLAGVNFIPGTKRFVAPEDAGALCAALGAERAVGIFRDAPFQLVLETVDALGLRWVQLHGHEPPAMVRRLADRCRVIRAVVSSEVDRLHMAELAPLVAAFLVDGPAPGSGAPVTHDGISTALFFGRPFFVAGGLAPRTVAEVVRRLRPDGVDVATGVTSGGVIDPDLVASFIEQARGASLGDVS